MAKKEIGTIQDMKKLLQVEKDAVITLAQVSEARVIYIDIAKAGFESEKYTKTNIALSVLNNAFMKLLVTEEVKEMRKSVFAQDSGRGYNAILSIKTGEGKHENLLSVKFKKESDIETLCDKHGFYYAG